MAVTVFVWYPKQKHIGHATLKVDGGVYVSWWPSPDNDGTTSKTRDKKGSAAAMFGSTAMASSIAFDRRAEGNRNPDWASAPITGLNEMKINRWYQELSPRSPLGVSRHTPQRTVGKYDLLSRQCASTVIEALLVGGLNASKFPLAAALLTKTTYITPLDVKDIAASMTGEVGFFDAARLLVTPSMGNFLPYLK